MRTQLRQTEALRPRPALLHVLHRARLLQRHAGVFHRGFDPSILVLKVVANGGGIARRASLLLMRLLALRGGAYEDEDGYSDTDLSPDGAIAQRIRAELAAHTALRDDCFVVHATADGRGKGLFVAPGHSISSGSYLFDYEGRWLESDEYEERYPQEGVARADYAVGIARADGSTVFVVSSRNSYAARAPCSLSADCS